MKLGYLLKRGLDVTAAATALVVAAPAMAAIATAIVLESPGGALFIQERIGRGGKTFRLLKFRTMLDAPIRYNPDGSTRVDANDNRVTRVGGLLRGALDELPQLINVLRGEMSLVGPRPEMATQWHLYEPADLKKLEALPGLTSLPIVLGRGEIPWRQRVQLDLEYVEHWSFWLDVRIIAQTLLMPLGVRPFSFSDVIPQGTA